MWFGAHHKIAGDNLILCIGFLRFNDYLKRYERLLKLFWLLWLALLNTGKKLNGTLDVLISRLMYLTYLFKLI